MNQIAVRTKELVCAAHQMFSRRRLALVCVCPAGAAFLWFHVENNAGMRMFGIPSVLCLMATVFVWNFPGLAPSFHKRPIYLGDLTEREDAEEGGVIKHPTPHVEELNRIREKFHRRFFVLVNVSFVLLLAAFMDYGYHLFLVKSESVTHVVEVAGIAGGVLSLWSRSQQVAGRILLKACFYMRKRQLASQKCVAAKYIGEEDVVFPFQWENQRRLDADPFGGAFP
jgi:hypothetical protein